MNDSKKSNGWKYWLVVVGLLMMAIAYFVHDRSKVEKQRDAALKEADDFFNMARQEAIIGVKAKDDIRKGYERLLNIRDHRQDSTDRINTVLLVQNNRLRAQIRPVSVVMAGDTAEMRSQLILRDQAIDNCDSSLSVRSGELAQAKSFHDAVQALEAKRDTIQERSIIALNAAAWDNAKRADKLEKKLDNPWSFGLHAGYGLMLNNGQVLAGPQVGAGIQYKIRIRRKR